MHCCILVFSIRSVRYFTSLHKPMSRSSNIRLQLGGDWLKFYLDPEPSGQRSRAVEEQAIEFVSCIEPWTHFCECLPP